MNYQVRITTRAYQEIREIVQWWAANRSHLQAARWYDAIMEQISHLSTMPEIHGYARENRKSPFELRELHFGVSGKPTHRVIFKIAGDTVEVITIRHAAQDELGTDEL